MTDNGDDRAAWGLVVPFVACQSKGGPFEDRSFVAGFQAGRLDDQLGAAKTQQVDRMTFPFLYDALRPLVELLAMRHGWTLEWEPVGDGSTWAVGVFTRADR